MPQSREALWWRLVIWPGVITLGVATLRLARLAGPRLCARPLRPARADSGCPRRPPGNPGGLGNPLRRSATGTAGHGCPGKVDRDRPHTAAHAVDGGDGRAWLIVRGACR